MERITYTNGYGDSVVLDYTSDDYILAGHEGLAAADLTPIVTQGYKQQGVSLEEIQYGVRPITIYYYISADSMSALYGRQDIASKAFNPLAGEGVLLYQNDCHSRAIKAVTTVKPEPEERYGALQLYSVELTAFNPLFYDPIESGYLARDFVGGLRFPIRFNPTIKFAERDNGTQITITGDAPAPIRIEILGDCTNPRVTHRETGKEIRAGNAFEPVTLAKTDRLIVNTAYGQKTADLLHADGTRVPVNHLLDDRTNFFSLTRGVNTLVFRADLGTPKAYIYWRNWWTGAL